MLNNNMNKSKDNDNSNSSKSSNNKYSNSKINSNRPAYNNTTQMNSNNHTVQFNKNNSNSFQIDLSNREEGLTQFDIIFSMREKAFFFTHKVFPWKKYSLSIQDCKLNINGDTEEVVNLITEGLEYLTKIQSDLIQENNLRKMLNVQEEKIIFNLKVPYGVGNGSSSNNSKFITLKNLLALREKNSVDICINLKKIENMIIESYLQYKALKKQNKSLEGQLNQLSHEYKTQYDRYSEGKYN
mmetsp:Transcript_4836/g.5004  ORF Transcript_4836/g.5004 Transcript_4836/m.5004 type:complete len:241 (-) Transcript_4836:66-788(-)